MKRLTLTTVLTALVVLLFSAVTVSAQDVSSINWDAYSKSLVKALNSSNEGVRLSAMQQVIRYSDKVHVSAARYAVMETFQDSDQEKVRQLALVTLYKINNPLDMGLLERQVNFEENDTIKKQIAAILVDSGRAKYSGEVSGVQVAGVQP